MRFAAQRDIRNDGGALIADWMASFMASSSLRSYLHRSPNGLINFGLPRRSLLTRRVNEASDLTVTSGLHCVCETCLFLLKSSFSSTCSPRIHLSSNILTSTLFSLFSTSSAKFSFYFIPLDGACRSHILFFSVLFIRKKKISHLDNRRRFSVSDLQKQVAPENDSTTARLCVVECEKVDSCVNPLVSAIWVGWFQNQCMRTQSVEELIFLTCDFNGYNTVLTCCRFKSWLPWGIPAARTDREQLCRFTTQPELHNAESNCLHYSHHLRGPRLARSNAFHPIILCPRSVFINLGCTLREKQVSPLLMTLTSYDVQNVDILPQRLPAMSAV